MAFNVVDCSSQVRWSLTLTVTLITALGGFAVRAEAESLGEQVYVAHCVTCHQVTGQGLPPAFPALSGNVQVGDVDHALNTVLGGSGAMPAFDSLSDEEIAAVLTHVRTSWENSYSVVDSTRVAEFRASLVVGVSTPLTTTPSFTAEQAQRGREAYVAHCAECHGFDYTPDDFSPGLRGAAFDWFWEGRTVLEFYETVRTRMPWGNANSLPTHVYVDIVAHILAINEYPAGDAELVADDDLLRALVID